jgi:hypothetical protein
VVFRAGLWVWVGKEERAALAAHVTAYRCAASGSRAPLDALLREAGTSERRSYLEAFWRRFRSPKSAVIPDGAADPGPSSAKSTGVPALRYRCGGDDRVGAEKNFVWNAFAAGYASAKAVFECARARWGVKGCNRLRRRAKRAP